MDFAFYAVLISVFLSSFGVKGLPPRDSIPPAIQCPSSIVVKSKQSSEVVCWSFPKANDNSGKPTVTCSHKAGLLLKPPSTTLIKCEAKDAAGNKAYCQFAIEVIDVAPPQITCPADKEIDTGSKSTYRLNWDNPKVSDNSGVPPRVIATMRRGSLVRSPGIYQISYDARDNSGNRATCSFTIKLTVPDCKLKLPPPVNGAVSCWSHSANVNVCTVSCNSNFDFAFRPASVYYCDRGVWHGFNPLSGINNANWPDCSVKSTPQGLQKMSALFYYAGDSSDPNVVAKIKQNSIFNLRTPFIPPFFCMIYPQCNVQNMQVYAGKKSKK